MVPATRGWQARRRVREPVLKGNSSMTRGPIGRGGSLRLSLTRPFPRNRGGLGLPTTAFPLQSRLVLGRQARAHLPRTVGRWNRHYDGEADRRRGVSKPGHTRCGAVPSPGGRVRSAAGLGDGGLGYGGQFV